MSFGNGIFGILHVSEKIIFARSYARPALFCYKRNSLTIKKLFSRCRSKISHITDVIEECMVRAKFPLYIQECLLSVMEFILHILFKVTQKFH